MMKYLIRKDTMKEPPPMDDYVIPEQENTKEKESLSTVSTRGSECEVQDGNKGVKLTFVRPPSHRVSETISMFR